MKNFFLIAAATQVQGVKIQTSSAVDNEASKDPFEVSRSPLLEKVVKDLSTNLNELIPDQVPEGMDHLLCLFEAKEGTDEWKRLDCDKWKEAKIDPQSIAKA